jgi:hypothetical protein
LADKLGKTGVLAQPLEPWAIIGEQWAMQWSRWAIGQLSGSG